MIDSLWPPTYLILSEPPHGWTLAYSTAGRDSGLGQGSLEEDPHNLGNTYHTSWQYLVKHTTILSHDKLLDLKVMIRPSNCYGANVGTLLQPNYRPLSNPAPSLRGLAALPPCS